MKWERDGREAYPWNQKLWGRGGDQKENLTFTLFPETYLLKAWLRPWSLDKYLKCLILSVQQTPEAGRAGFQMVSV